jgi:hypothetical protein
MPKYSTVANRDLSSPIARSRREVFFSRRSSLLSTEARGRNNIAILGTDHDFLLDYL